MYKIIFSSGSEWSWLSSCSVGVGDIVLSNRFNDGLFFSSQQADRFIVLLESKHGVGFRKININDLFIIENEQGLVFCKTLGGFYFSSDRKSMEVFNKKDISELGKMVSLEKCRYKITKLTDVMRREFCQ